MGAIEANSRQHLSSLRGLGWFLLLRVMVASLFLGGTLVYQFQADPTVTFNKSTLYILLGLTYLQSLISAFVLPRTRRLRLFAQTQISWDLFLATFMIYLTGGYFSHFSFLYILIIFCASIFLPRRDLYIVASASAILYGSLLDLQYYDRLPMIGGLVYPELKPGDEIVYAVFLNVIAFLLIAVFSSILAERGRSSARELERKEVDLEELEGLNRTILANINSGLMIINPYGRIRSYNEAASRITGYSLWDVYDMPVNEIFSGFEIYSGGELNVVRRGEGSFRARDGESRRLGFTSSLVEDVSGATVGLLVVFQDLTEFQEMEEQLRRADRLAAVGRLASGMAHEIRNPLASISGSVQLLMENPAIKEEERRLMGIVVHEAERLSQLLTDFLNFAKPARPTVEEFRADVLFDELIDMLKSDKRFASVNIVRENASDEDIISADRKLIRQVLWDLAINAVEAMQGEGYLWIGVNRETPSIYVEDTGPGIPETIAGKVFEPFFTTKETGTGLGLATVYSVIEAHGGHIDITSGRKGGALIDIVLPSRRHDGYTVLAADANSPETKTQEK